MSVAFRSQSANSSTTASVVVTTPATLAQGDVMIAIASSAVTAPAGWAQYSKFGFVWYKVATNAEPVSYTFTANSGTGIAVAIAAYSGADPSCPIATAVSVQNAAGGNIVATSTPGSFNKTAATFGVCAAMGFGNTSSTTVSGTVRSTTTQGGGTNQLASLAIADQTWANPSLGGGPSFTMNQTGATSAYLIIVGLNPDTTTAYAHFPTPATVAANTQVTLSLNANNEPWGPDNACVVVAVATSAINAALTVGGVGAFTNVLNVGSGSLFVSVWYRRLTAADAVAIANATGTVKATTSVSSDISLSAIGYVSAGNAGIAPVVAVASTAYAAATTWGWPSVAAGNNPGSVLCVNAVSTATAPSAVDARLALRNTSVAQTDASQRFYDAGSYTTAGATPAYTESFAAGQTGRAITIALASTQAPPSAPTLTTPTAGTYLDATLGTTFAWTYNPVTLIDTQTGYQLRVKGGAFGATYNYWTGSAWTTTPTTVTSTASTVTPTGLTNGNTYNWSVATQDQGGLGPFSADNTFNTAATPVATITSPSVTATTSTTVVTWTETLGSSPQTSYRVVVETGSFGAVPGSGSPVYDSGVVGGAALSQNATGLANGVAYRVFVQVTQTGGQVSAWAHTDFSTVFDAPATPTLVAVWDSTLARCAVTVQGHDNLLTAADASLETSSAWSANSNCSIGRPTVGYALDGTAVLRLTSLAAGLMNAHTPFGTGGYPATAGKQYTATAFFRGTTVGRQCQVYIAFWNASGSNLSNIAGALVTDNTSSWVQATVTSVAPAGTAFVSTRVDVLATGAAGENHDVDEISVAPGSGTTWTQGGFAGTGSYTVEASEDGGSTWVSVRGGPFTVDSAADQQFTAYDYERTPLATVQYRARVSDGSGLTLVTSPNSAIATITETGVTTWWVKDIQTPANNMSLCDAQENVRTSPGDSVAVYPAGRTNPIVLKGPVHGATSKIRTIVQTEADRLDALALFSTQDDILVQDPRGRQWYAEWVGDLVETQLRTPQPYYAIERSWVEVDVLS